ncbi:hypothetical protein FPZ12_002985 [Amycolatopsis acidicola]|uniref:LysR substrate-binding domain-containing protein n=1 Tax=Amycolatopsis acidicola TaxID=2596893 RepID=A0A5N0VK07_9PSEU|nr:hypothetical protein [Amycolatopsis acidicola]KAA9166535.1 hypothetical protein FPZ12_002985 [Amycolatopsis acidicola]
MADVQSMPWVFTYHDTGRSSVAMRQLQLLGIEPRGQTVLDSFLALPYYLVGTRRLALVQRRLAPSLTRDGRLRAVGCPWDPEPVSETLWWHPWHTDNPEHTWLRGILTRAGRELDTAEGLS